MAENDAKCAKGAGRASREDARAMRAGAPTDAQRQSASVLDRVFEAAGLSTLAEAAPPEALEELEALRALEHENDGDYWDDEEWEYVEDWEDDEDWEDEELDEDYEADEAWEDYESDEAPAQGEDAESDEDAPADENLAPSEVAVAQKPSEGEGAARIYADAGARDAERSDAQALEPSDAPSDNVVARRLEKTEAPASSRAQAAARPRPRPQAKRTNPLVMVALAAAVLIGAPLVTTGLIAADMALFPAHWETLAESSEQALAVAGDESTTQETPSSEQVKADNDAPRETAGQTSAGPSADDGASTGSSASADARTATASQDDSREAPAQTGESYAAFNGEAAFAAASQAVAAFAETNEPTRFSAPGTSASAFAEEQAEALQAATRAFTDNGYQVGYVAFDLVNGQGIAYNADTGFFPASAMKAPYIAYVLQSELASGAASWDEEMHKDYIIEGTGVMASEDRYAYSLQEVLANAIMHSDNTAYALLMDRFGADGFRNWAQSAGVSMDAGRFLGGAGYPVVTPRELALLWVQLGEGVASEAAAASAPGEVMGGLYEPSNSTLGSWLSVTDESFVRQALGAESWVYGKVGYEVADYGSPALVEGAVAVDESRARLFIIMSDAGFDDTYYRDNEVLMVNLANALDAAL